MALNVRIMRTRQLYFYIIDHTLHWDFFIFSQLLFQDMFYLSLMVVIIFLLKSILNKVHRSNRLMEYVVHRDGDHETYSL